MAGGLTYANTLGAIDGINQSGSGVTIPDTFLRWAQDVLFDNNGIIKRRAPFAVYPLYSISGLVSQVGNSTSFVTTATSGTGSVATLTFVSHNFTLGQPIIVSGVTPTGYNGAYIVTAATATTITYASSTTGAQTVAGSVVAGAERIVTTISTINPIGERIIGIVLTSAASSRIVFYDGNTRGPYVTVLGSILPQDTIFDCKQASTAGMWLSFLTSYVTGGSSNPYYQFYWRGGCGVESSYTATFGVSSGNATATGTFNSSITFATAQTTIPSKGMFVYATISSVDYYLGTVATADSAGITLEKNIIRPALSGSTLLANSATSYSIRTVNVRPYIKNHARGLLTVTTGASSTITSGNAGTDGEGHWKSAGIDSNWALYRASDGAWLGDVGSVTDNTTIVGSATAYPATSITMKADEYIARPYGGIPTTSLTGRASNTVAGVFNAVYTGLQWYGNAGDSISRNRIVFSNYSDSEAVDLSLNDNDSIIIPSLSEMRGLASSSSGLLVFMADKTFIVRGNSRFNFSLEELYPEGCLSSMSIVEYGGGVFWASRTGMFYYDGSTVRNLTKDNLGSYYSQSLKEFNVNTDRIYGFFHKDYLFMHFTAWKSAYNPVRYEPIYASGITSTPAIKDYTINDWDPEFTPNDFALDSNTPIYWSYNTLYSGGIGASSNTITGKWGSGSSPVWGSSSSQLVWGPADVTESFTFAVYLPTGAITCLSNFGFRNAIKIDTNSGLKALMGVNITGNTYVYPRIIDVDSIFSSDQQYTSSVDAELIENNGIAATNYYKGPDFYIQTKHYTMGDPLLKKWFKQMFLNLYLIDGCLRLDLVDNEDNDYIDISRKRHKNWELFTSISYTWDELSKTILPTKLSPNRSTWLNVENYNATWYSLTNTLFERRKKRFSWRNASIGFRLYQVNNYRPYKFTLTERPFNVILESWDIGFKPMRQSRV